MIDNLLNRLPKEVIYYSLIPVSIVVIITLFLFIFMFISKKKTFRLGILIKLCLMISIAIVLPLIMGYTIWIIEKFIGKGIIMDNIGYISLIIFLCVGLFVLLLWVFASTLNYMKELKNT